MDWTHDGYLLTDDTSRIDLDAVCSLLAGSYWAANRPRETVERSLTQSLCFGLLHAENQIGFGRLITDRATFSYLCDVIIHPDHRGKGIGRWMVRCILEHPEIQGTRVALFTKDAQKLYESFGFRKHCYDCLVKLPDPAKS